MLILWTNLVFKSPQSDTFSTVGAVFCLLIRNSRNVITLLQLFLGFFFSFLLLACQLSWNVVALGGVGIWQLANIHMPTCNIYIKTCSQRIYSQEKKMEPMIHPPLCKLPKIIKIKKIVIVNWCTIFRI